MGDNRDGRVTTLGGADLRCDDLRARRSLAFAAGGRGARSRSRPRGQEAQVFLFTKRSGQRVRVRFMPGLLVASIALSVVLTVLLNVLLRAF
jgi:hypothetical protein